MNRLVHSEPGFIRSLQISKANFFVYVEGGLDRPFFDRVVSNTFNGSSVRAQIIAAKELPGATGGKARLLQLFRCLRKKGDLVSESFGKRLTHAFFADKDLDDVTGTRARSNHFVYSSTYDIEGHLFSCGDLSRAVADACAITQEQATALLGDQSSWIRSCVENWREWTILCMICHIEKTAVGCSFGRPSAVNPDIILAADAAKVVEFKEKVQLGLGMSAVEFERLYVKYSDRLSGSLREHRALRFFKGKWLKSILEKDLQSKGSLIPDAKLQGAGDRVAATLVAQVGARSLCRCCDSYTQSLVKLARTLEDTSSPTDRGSALLQSAAVDG